MPYLTCVYDAVEGLKYIITELKNQNELVENLHEYDNKMIIGAHTVSRINSNGKITIWNSALSEQQIQEYMICPPNGDEEGLIGYWNLKKAI